MKITYYKKKAYAIKRQQILRQEGKESVVCNRNITNFFVLDNHEQFIELIKKETVQDFYEFIPTTLAVPLYFDIEVYKDASPFFENTSQLLDKLHDHVYRLVNNILKDKVGQTKRIVLESHSETKRSFHILYIINNDNNERVLFKNVKTLKDVYKMLKLDQYKDNLNRHLIDPSVYREGLFRTIYSSKMGENRPLVKSDISDDFEEIETFVTYHNHISHEIVENFNEGSKVVEELSSSCHTEGDTEGQTTVNVPEELTNTDKENIIQFVKESYHHFPNKVRDVLIDREHNCIVVALDEKFCHFQNRAHKSNNQYIVIDTTSSKQKCHDPDCKEKRHDEIKLEKYPSYLNEIIKKCLKINKHELELIDKAIEECKTYITENFDDDVKVVSFDKNNMVFRGDVNNRDLVRLLKGKCPECDVEHHISDNGYSLKCKKCLSIFPKQQLIPVDTRYKNLNSFWMNYNQLVNTGTINNIINIYNGTDLEFSCDVKLDDAIFGKKEVTKIANQILDGHKVTMISKLIHTLNKNFVYSRNNWYHFTGSIWKADNDNIEMKKVVIDLSSFFDRIKTWYDSKPTGDITMTLNKNIKSLINKLHKPGFQDDIIKGAKIYFNDESFLNYLNSKKHLVPFRNGVYDLLENRFRKTKKDDYINYTFGFEYDDRVDNPEVHQFINNILPNPPVRDFVLKKLSECLNGDIPNTHFLMFIGDGANGKSQLLNLVKLTMGDFGEKVEVTLLTRKRNNANEANTEKVKLMNKRFAFLSEPEDGEKINIGLLKELTGSEEIVARNLYEGTVSFVMEAKLFLACNELPEIKGEDTALWRRIRVIDFPSRFVDDPKESNEYKIDRTLPSRMREDITWRQTFIKILLEYYYKDVSEPQEVKVRTNEYREENNDFYNWMSENIEQQEDAVLKLKDVVEFYLGKPSKKERERSKYKKEVEKFIKERFSGLKWEYGKVRYSSEEDTSSTTYGWKHVTLREM